MFPTPSSLGGMALLFTVTGCSIFGGPKALDSAEDSDADTDVDADTDADGDTDTDTDADSDSDADTDADTDTDTPTEVNCSQDVSPDATTNDCYANRSLSCGSNFLATTEQGTTDLDEDAYYAWTCGWDFGGDYSGMERVFEFDHPGGGNVDFTLYSPCGTMGLAIVRYEDTETCPTADTLLSVCEWSETTSSATVTVSDPSPNKYLVIVDSADTSAALNYRLRVECAK